PLGGEPAAPERALLRPPMWRYPSRSNRSALWQGTRADNCSPVLSGGVSVGAAAMKRGPREPAMPEDPIPFPGVPGLPQFFRSIGGNSANPSCFLTLLATLARTSVMW